MTNTTKPDAIETFLTAFGVIRTTTTPWLGVTAEELPEYPLERRSRVVATDDNMTEAWLRRAKELTMASVVHADPAQTARNKPQLEADHARWRATVATRARVKGTPGAFGRKPGAPTDAARRAARKAAKKARRAQR